MSYLKLAQEAIKRTAGKDAGGHRQEAGRTTTTEPPLNAAEGRPLTCSACHWHEPNPWSHNPDLTAWCQCRMEPITPDSPTCEDFHRSQVLTKQNHQILQSQERPEGILTCADCPHFVAYPTSNSGRAWGRCSRRKKGRYGCAMACEAGLTDEGL